MNNCTIENARERKAEAEIKISEILLKFMSDTGVEVVSINGDFVPMTSQDKTHVSVKSIHIDVKL